MTSASGPGSTCCLEYRRDAPDCKRSVTVTRTASQDDAVGGHSKTSQLCAKVTVPNGAELEPAARVRDVHLLRKVEAT